MKKGIVFSVVAGMLLAGTLYADCNDMKDYHKKDYSEYAQYKKGDCNHKKSKSYAKYHKKDRDSYSKKESYYKRGSYTKRDMDMSKMFKGLNLTKEQRFEISILNDEMKLALKKLRKPSVVSRGLSKYVSEKGFDKSAYLKDRKEMYEKVLEIRANTMQKMFNVLTREQLKMFKDRIKSHKHIKRH